MTGQGGARLPQTANEGQDLEWKSSWRDEHLKGICAFANAQGGVMVIGKDDRGDIVGVRDPLRLMEEIPNKIRSLLGIVVNVNLRSGDGGEFLEISVDPHPNPISYKGEYYSRSGSTTLALEGAALNRFLLGKHGPKWDDVPLPGVKLSEMDSRTLADFCERGIAGDRLPPEVRSRSAGELIDMLRLREGPYLRRAAALLFHSDPCRFFPSAFVKVGYFRTKTDLAYQDVIEGNLFFQVDRTIDLLRTKYSKTEITYAGIYRQEKSPMPIEALREAVLNAVTHRDYDDPTPIQIRVHDDGIELWNPGRLPSDWTFDKLMGVHASVPQNPAIANVFFRAGMIEAWGRGIGHIVNTCRSAGTAVPRWEVDAGGVRLTFKFAEAGNVRSRPGSRASQPESSTMRPEWQPESGTGQPELQPGSQPEWRPESQSERRTGQPESLTDRVLRHLANGPMSKAELSRSLGQKQITGQLNKVVRKLIEEGRIEYTIPEKPGSRLQQYRLVARRKRV